MPTAQTTTSAKPATAMMWRRAVVRDPHQAHRPSTPLELFFDLAIVVAVAQAAHELESLLVEQRYADGIIGFAMAFTALWWAWMNFTWFATAHDSDDIPYRILTFVQISGALVMAAGIPAAIDHLDFGVITAGYVIMRVALVAQWLRVRSSIPEHRQRATIYAVGILAVQLLWIARLALPHGTEAWSWLVLILCEVTIPVVAERRSHRTVFHLGHIAERYGLLTIIVLGESLLAATVRDQRRGGRGRHVARRGRALGRALLIAFCAWWLYFNRRRHNEPAEADTAFLWGYGHLLLFASLAALGAGVQLTAAWLDHEHAGTRLAALGVAIPAAVYLVSTAAIDRLVHGTRGTLPLKAVEAATIIAFGLFAPVPVAVLGTAAVFVVAVVLLELQTAGRLAIER